jgi:2'-phosphotransferase
MTPPPPCPLLLQKRFVLDEEAQPPRIRAAQGHSIQLDAPELEPVASAGQVALAVHVTSPDGWAAIQASGELRRMSRTHIHFATSPAHMRGNSWATVILRLDLAAALAAGQRFFLSANRVLLCEGPLPVALVQQVALAELPEEWQQEAAASKGQFKRHKGEGGRSGGRGGGGGGGRGSGRGGGRGQQQQPQQQQAGEQRQEQGGAQGKAAAGGQQRQQQQEARA